MAEREERRPRLVRLVDALAARRRALLLVALALALSAFTFWLPPEARRTLLVGLLARRLLVGMLLVFSLVTLSLLWSAGQRLDELVFMYFNRHHLRRPWLDGLMWLATQLGSGPFGLGLAGIAFYYGDSRLAVELVLGILTLWLFVETVKALTARARPFISLAGTQIVGGRAIGRSFPSGHTSQAFFLASFLVNTLEPGLLPGLAVYAIALLVGFTRVYIGVHYPRDVVAGAILGYIWGIMLTLLDPVFTF